MALNYFSNKTGDYAFQVIFPREKLMKKNLDKATEKTTHDTRMTEK